MTKEKKPLFAFESVGVGEGYYPNGMGYLERYIELLKELDSQEISDKVKEELKILSEPANVYSAQVFRFEPNLDERILDAAMRFNVTHYEPTEVNLGGKLGKRFGNPTFNFVSELPAILEDYQGRFRKPVVFPFPVPAFIWGLAGNIKTIERRQSDVWPRALATKSKKGKVYTLGMYEGRCGNSTLDVYFVSDYKIYGKPLTLTNNLFLYTKFSKTPFVDSRKALESFRDFSYSNCSFLK